MEVVHYFIRPDQVDAEIDRARGARNAVIDELRRLQDEMPQDAPGELDALLDVHLLLLQDEALAAAIKHWISDRLYNAEWALTTQLEVVSRQDRKSTRLNSSHLVISYAVFCLKKKSVLRRKRVIFRRGTISRPCIRPCRCL